MNQQIAKLYEIAGKPRRRIIGLMSGTSLDGLDIAICTISGSGKNSAVEVEHFETIPYDDTFKNNIREVFAKENIKFEKLSSLHSRIAVLHSKMILELLQRNNIEKNEIDLIASHGQTVYHSPGKSTFQIGDGDHLAFTTGLITVSDFRQKHVAAGGEGAPLAVYGDRILFSKPGEDRLLLNIGGIANFTYLPGNDQLKVICTDTGPGNTLMDTHIRHSSNAQFDFDGRDAASGNVSEVFLKALKEHDFFKQPFPKTTGPELFNKKYIEEAIQKINPNQLACDEDITSTLNQFTADTIVEAIRTCLVSTENLKVFVSGGGSHNKTLMQRIQEQMSDCKFSTVNELGVDAGAKEAVLFAVLANECICGQPWGEASEGIPQVLMGKISLPF